MNFEYNQNIALFESYVAHEIITLQTQTFQMTVSTMWLREKTASSPLSAAVAFTL